MKTSTGTGFVYHGDLMFDDGINNDFEKAHHKGLRRGFDLGWTYKGRFDRAIIRDEIDRLESAGKTSEAKVLQDILNTLISHENNRESIIPW